MSAIFGIVQLDGRPAPRELLAALRRAVARDEAGGACCFADAAGFGQLPLASTPEWACEEMPRAGDGLLFAAAGRLDNRDELLAALGVPAALAPQVADTALMLRAYGRWGEGCAARLLGDWSFAAWHSDARRLVLARDQFGVTGLHYYLGGGRLAFASSLPALLALPCVPRRLNELQLARLLAVWHGDGFATLYQDVARLPPAHLLVVEGGHARAVRYWRMEDAPPVELPSDEAYAEAFLAHLEAAVAARLRSAGPIGATLSGGLDSGSVTAVAARLLRARGAGLAAFTAAPRFPADDLVGPRVAADEWPIAARSAALVGVAEHIAVRAEQSSPTATLAQIQRVLGEPQHAAANFHWIFDLLAAARARGVNVLLTGQVGNGGVSWAGDPVRAFSLLRAGRAAEAWQALAAYRAASGRSWAGAVRRQLLGPLRRSLRAELWRLRPVDAAWRAYAPINEAFARRIRVTQVMRDEGHDPTHSQPVPGLARRYATLLPTSNPLGALWHTMGAAYGVEVRDPTADVRLLRFCLGVPADQDRRGDQGRLLIRRAMAGALPPEVLAAERFGQQAADIGRRLLADRPAVEALLASLGRSPAAAEYLDVPMLARSWAGLGHTPDLLAALTLMRGLSAGVFLVAHGTLTGDDAGC